MEIKDYLSIYQLPIGTKVVIKECHSKPELIGKVGKVVGWTDVATCGYPLMVYLDEPIYIPIALGIPMAYPFQGPHFCRPDELEAFSNIPDIFTKSFEQGEKQDE